MEKEIGLLDAIRQEIIKSRDELDFSHRGLWKELPVDFITFCRDFLKEPLFEGPQENFAREFIGAPNPECFWSDAKRVALLFWGKGSGKGSASAKLLVYAGYLLKMMWDPRTYFKIGRTAPIHMVNVSYNSFQAKTVFFQGYLVPTILNCINPKTNKNFFEECGMDLRVGEGDILSNMIHFERPTKEGEGGITAVSLAGDRGTAEGFSPLLIFVDEISSMQSPAKAEKLVSDLEKSAQSRFGDFYKLIIASFKQGRNCLMTLKVAEAEQKQLEDTYVDRAATWEVNRLKRQEEFKSMYDKNPVQSARAYECKEVEGVDEKTFIKLVDRLQDAFLDSSHNPFVGEVIKCRTDQLKILEFKGFFRPNINVKYHMHIDLAKGTGTDRAGIFLGHRDGLESLTSEDLQAYISGELPDKQFKVKADIILQLLPDKDAKEIILEDVRKFILKLHKMGFRMEVTLDGYQSMDMIQQLNAKGIPAELLSVDRDRKAYDSMLSLIYRRSLELYDHPILYRELEELEESDNGRKIDHPYKSMKRSRYEDNIDSGSKDIADSCAGAVLKAILAPAPRIPILPSKGDTHYSGQEEYEDRMKFESSMTNGHIPIGRDGKPKDESWSPLMPSRS